MFRARSAPPLEPLAGSVAGRMVAGRNPAQGLDFVDWQQQLVIRVVWHVQGDEGTSLWPTAGGR